MKNFKRGRRATLNPARHLLAQGLAKGDGDRSADNLVSIDLQPHRLPVRVQPRREAEKSADNLALINLQLHRLPVQVRAKREAEDREGRTSMLDLVASQRVQRKLHLSPVRDNRSVERKRARGLHRRGHNNSRTPLVAASEFTRLGECRGVWIGNTATQRRGYRACTSSSFYGMKPASGGAPSDIDEAGRSRASGKRASQTPYKSKQFCDLHSVQGRAFQQLIA